MNRGQYHKLFCFTLIGFLPLIKQISQFLMKGKLFHEREREGERKKDTSLSLSVSLSLSLSTLICLLNTFEYQKLDRHLQAGLPAWNFSLITLFILMPFVLSRYLRLTLLFSLSLAISRQHSVGLSMGWVTPFNLSITLYVFGKKLKKKFLSRNPKLSRSNCNLTWWSFFKEVKYIVNKDQSCLLINLFFLNLK